VRSIEEFRGDGQIEFLFSDVDDTITLDGVLYPEAFTALWNLRHAGIRVIPVTGGPGGWAHMIIRQWPVEAIITESGAFYYYRSAAGIAMQVHPSIKELPFDPRAASQRLRERVLREVPGSRLSQDQNFRLYDLAFDVNETQPGLGWEQAEEILRICAEEGARSQVSSIHVNAWYGAYDKLETTKHYLREQCGLSEGEMKRRVAYCGDALNDQPMFEFFPHSFGVANIRRVKERMEIFPSYVTQSEGGFGFAEVAEALIRGGAEGAAQKM
jgi:hypothetical protein